MRSLRELTICELRYWKIEDFIPTAKLELRNWKTFGFIPTA